MAVIDITLTKDSERLLVLAENHLDCQKWSKMKELFFPFVERREMAHLKLSKGFLQPHAVMCFFGLQAEQSITSEYARVHLTK